MKNVAWEISGDTLTIKVDLTQDFGKSGSGKTNVVASSEGFQSLGKDGVSFGLNVVRK